MSETLINPKILTWARERTRISVEELAREMKEEPAVIEAWESGIGSPSYAALEKLAYTYLKVPIAVFFFPEPPKIDEAKNKFRRLPASELARLSPDTFQKIRQGIAYQDSLREIGPTIEHVPMSRALEGSRLNAISLAKKARLLTGISINQQFAFQSSA